MNNHDKHHNLVDEVVDGVIAELSLDTRVRAANLSQDDFRVLELIVVIYIRHRLDQIGAGVNKELMKDCLEKSGESLDEFDAATVIFRELWKRLWKTHKLSDVKWG